jgi:hypothetical protein
MANNSTNVPEQLVNQLSCISGSNVVYISYLAAYHLTAFKFYHNKNLQYGTLDHPRYNSVACDLDHQHVQRFCKGKNKN